MKLSNYGLGVVALVFFVNCSQAQVHDKFKEKVRAEAERLSEQEGGLRSKEELIDYVSKMVQVGMFIRIIQDPESDRREGPAGQGEAEWASRVGVQVFRSYLDKPSHYYHTRVFFAKLTLVAAKYLHQNGNKEEAKILFEEGFRVAMSLIEDSGVKTEYKNMFSYQNS